VFRAFFQKPSSLYQEQCKCLGGRQHQLCDYASVPSGAGYPEAYFGRLALPADAVMAVVSACRADDIYNQARGRRSPWATCMKASGPLHTLTGDGGVCAIAPSLAVQAVGYVQCRVHLLHVPLHSHIRQCFQPRSGTSMSVSLQTPCPSPRHARAVAQAAHYPAPEHRTAALAGQAAGLYLALWFVPQVLHSDAALMRTLVDRRAPILTLPLLLSQLHAYAQSAASRPLQHRIAGALPGLKRSWRPGRLLRAGTLQTRSWWRGRPACTRTCRWSGAASPPRAARWRAARGRRARATPPPRSPPRCPRCAASCGATSRRAPSRWAPLSESKQSMRHASTLFGALLACQQRRLKSPFP
jgi:hypothetical protein